MRTGGRRRGGGRRDPSQEDHPHSAASPRRSQLGAAANLAAGGAAARAAEHAPGISPRLSMRNTCVYAGVFERFRRSARSADDVRGTPNYAVRGAGELFTAEVLSFLEKGSPSRSR